MHQNTLDGHQPTAADMSTNVAPDSWEESDLADASASDLQQKLIKLNVNAAEFVPSFASFSANEDDDDDDNDGNKNGHDDQITTGAGGDKKLTGKCLV